MSTHWNCKRRPRSPHRPLKLHHHQTGHRPCPGCSMGSPKFSPSVRLQPLVLHGEVHRSKQPPPSRIGGGVAGLPKAIGAKTPPPTPRPARTMPFRAPLPCWNAEWQQNGVFLFHSEPLTVECNHTCCAMQDSALLCLCVSSLHGCFTGHV